MANYELNKQSLDWQKQMQAETWRREDNSIQRRVADLKASGLSPVLAAGSGAAASPPIAPMRMEAPQRSSYGLGKISDVSQAMMDVLRGKLELDQNAAQIRLINAETGRTEADKRRIEDDMARKGRRDPLEEAHIQAQTAELADRVLTSTQSRKNMAKQLDVMDQQISDMKLKASQSREKFPYEMEKLSYDIRNLISDLSSKEVSRRSVETQIVALQDQIEIIRYDADLAHKYGVRTDIKSGWTTQMQQAFNYLDRIWKGIFGE